MHGNGLQLFKHDNKFILFVIVFGIYSANQNNIIFPREAARISKPINQTALH